MAWQQLTRFNHIMIWFNKPSLKVRTNFFRLMAISQEVGLGLRDSVINILQTENNKTMKLVLKHVVAQLTAGKSLWDALDEHPEVFSSDQVELIRAAETIWSMPSVLREIAQEMENMQKIYAKIKSAITYPLVLLTFSAIAVVILLLFVIPTIVGLFPDPSQLPAVTILMLNISEFLRVSWFFLLLVIIGIIVWVRILYAIVLPFKIFVDRAMLTIPFLRDVTRSFYMYRFAKLLGDFSKAWVGTVKSFQQLNKIFNNYFYKRKAYTIGKDLATGFSLKDSIEWSTLLFDPILMQTIAIWENTWNLWNVLLAIADYYNYRFKLTIETLTSLIEPILMAFVAVIIWWIVASIFLPIADLVNVIWS